MTAHQGWLALVVVAIVVGGAVWAYIDGSGRIRRSQDQAKADVERAQAQAEDQSERGVR